MWAGHLVAQYLLQNSPVSYPLAIQSLRAKVILYAALEAQASAIRLKYQLGGINEECTSKGSPDTTPSIQRIYQSQIFAARVVQVVRSDSNEAQLSQSGTKKMMVIVASILLEKQRAEEFRDELSRHAAE